jgi:hypothetical protein
LGGCLLWADFLKKILTYVAQILEYAIAQYVSVMHNYFRTTKWVGTHFGLFFPNSSGHPGPHKKIIWPP